MQMRMKPRLVVVSKVRGSFRLEKWPLSLHNDIPILIGLKIDFRIMSLSDSLFIPQTRT